MRPFLLAGLIACQDQEPLPIPDVQETFSAQECLDRVETISRDVELVFTGTLARDSEAISMEFNELNGGLLDGMACVAEDETGALWYADALAAEDEYSPYQYISVPWASEELPERLTVTCMTEACETIQPVGECVGAFACDTGSFEEVHWGGFPVHEYYELLD